MAVVGMGFSLATLVPDAALVVLASGPLPSPPTRPTVADAFNTTGTITYTYDDLYRLTDAEYSTGEFYEYVYDPVGNRLSLTTHESVVNYQYDDANRLTSVNGQAYTWDNNGNPSTSSGQACSRTAYAATRMTTPTGSSRW